jgi:hypothetical protein
VANGAGPTGSAKIISFPRKVALGRARPGQVRDPLRHIEDEAERRRMRENLAAALLITFLLGMGYWLIDGLRASAHMHACMEADHRNCSPVDPRAVPGRPDR